MDHKDFDKELLEKLCARNYMELFIKELLQKDLYL